MIPWLILGSLTLWYAGSLYFAYTLAMGRVEAAQRELRRERADIPRSVNDLNNLTSQQFDLWIERIHQNVQLATRMALEKQSADMDVNWKQDGF